MDMKREFHYIPLADIDVSPGTVPFQRELNRKHVQSIVDNFDERLLDPLLVNMREDGTLALIRGQHRYEALREKFGTNAKAPCSVYFGLSPQEEAFVYAREERVRRAMRPVERYRGALEAGEPFECSVDALVQELGWRITSGGYGTEKTLHCLDAVLEIAKRGLTNLRDTLEILELAGWTSTPPAGVIRAVARVWALYRRELGTKERYAEFLREKMVSPESLHEQAKYHSYHTREQMRASYIAVITREYNRGHRGRHRLPTTRSNPSEE